MCFRSSGTRLCDARMSAVRWTIKGLCKDRSIGGRQGIEIAVYGIYRDFKA